jgi:Glycosyltransferase family 87
VRSNLRAIALVTLALIALFQLVLWYKAVETRGLDHYARGIDIAATLTGAQIIRDGDGGRLYELDTQRAAQERVLLPYITLRPDSLLPYLHPPFEAVLVAPLLGLPYGVLYLLWSGLILLALAGSVILLAGTLPVAGGARWLLLAAICSYNGVYQALWLGQSSPLVLLGLCGAYASLKRRRDGWAGVALVLMALKPQLLLVVALLLLLQWRWRPMVVCGGLLGGLGIAMMPLLGILWPLHYARFLSGITTWGGSHHEYPAIMHNWRGLAYNLFGGVAPGLVGPVVAGLTLIALLGLVLAWWRARGVVESAAGERAVDLTWAACVLLATLIAPHLYIHDLTLLIFPAWIIVARVVAGGWRPSLVRLWLVVLWSIHLLSLVFMMIADRWPSVPVVPTVLLCAAAAGLLVWLCGHPAVCRPTALSGRRPAAAAGD